VSPWLGLPLLARGSSRAATCPRGSGSPSRLRAAPGSSCVSAARALAPDSEQLRRWHVSPWLELPLWLGATPGLPRIPGLCGLQASKQISSGGPAIMISIGVRTYLPRCYMTMVTPHARKPCSRRLIKYKRDVWQAGCSDPSQCQAV
jgi:hypothetical protein